MIIYKLKEALDAEDPRWWDEDYCLEQVKHNPWSIAHVRNQTPEICLAAVKQDGNALQYAHEQTPEIIAVALANGLGYHNCIMWPRDPDEKDKFIKQVAFELSKLERN